MTRFDSVGVRSCAVLHMVCGGKGGFPRAVAGRWAATAHHSAVGFGARKKKSPCESILAYQYEYRVKLYIQPHIQLIDYPTVTYGALIIATPAKIIL